MADPVAELNMVYKVCGIADLATSTNIINREGFSSREDLGVLETDSDVPVLLHKLVSPVYVSIESRLCVSHD
jgi:hypothetical protein